MTSDTSSNVNRMDTIVSLCKRRGFVFPGSEIYGGLANTWDYGPLGAQMRQNLKRLWWQLAVEQRADMVGLDGAILMNPKVWQASGHVDTFNDPLVECLKCNSRYRTDHLLEGNKEYIELIQYVQDLVKQLLKQVRSDFDAYKADSKYLKGKFDEFEATKRIIDNSGITEEAANEILTNLANSFRVLAEKTEWSEKKFNEGLSKAENVDAMATSALAFLGELPQFFLNKKVKCEKCGQSEWSASKSFNLMFSTEIGSTAEGANTVYLRPETAQAMFVQFKNVLDTSRQRVPFGIAQIGKAFRNEITPGNFIFRTLEFEQMEVEYFVEEGEWEQHFTKWQDWMKNFAERIGMDMNSVTELDVPAEELAHYSKKTIDFEFQFPFGVKELWGLAYRTNFDLTNHQEHSGEKLVYTDPHDPKRKYVPHVIEPSMGVDRTLLAILVSAYDEEEVNGDIRTVLRFTPEIAPYQVAVLPLSKKPELKEVAEPLFAQLSQTWRTEYDETQSIGKRYRRQDEIGTPLCITVDFDSLEDRAVTVRDRDTMQQQRIAIEELPAYLATKLTYTQQ